MSSLLRLHVHPQTHSVPALTVEAKTARNAGGLTLQYQIFGNAELLVPALAKSQRRDELWRHTCAELFVAVPGQDAYVEFNFSPSGEWAVYQFDSYRTGMRPIECVPPIIDTWHDINELRMTVRCHLPASLATAASLQLGMTMVVEDREHGISYWALKHPDGKPDFHHREGFVVEL